MPGEPAKKKRRWLRRVFLAVFALLALAGVVFIAFQTAPAKRFIAARLNGMLSSSLPWPVELSGIGGLLPFVVTLDELRMGAAGDPWLELHGAAVNLDVLPLLRGQISVGHIGADELVLHRLPPSSDAEPDATNPIRLPVVDALPTWIRLAQMKVDRLVIDEAVAGHAAAFEVDGSFLPESESALNLRAGGLDGIQSTLVLSGGLRNRTVNFSLDAKDETLLHSLAGVEGPFGLAVSLSGPLADAALTLKATRAGAPLMSLEAQVSYVAPLRIAGTGHVDLPVDLVPAAVIERLGPSLDFDLDITLEDDNVLRVAESAVHTAHTDWTLDGTYAFAEATLDGTARFSCDDFYHLLDAANATGPMPLVLELPVHGTRPSLQITPVATLGGAPWLDGNVTLGLGESITAKGNVHVLPAGGLVPEAYRDLLAGGAEVTLDVAYAAGRATIHDTAIVVGETALTLAGTMDTAAHTLDLAIAGTAADLHVFEGLAGMPLAGILRADLAAKGDGSGTTVTGTLGVENLTASKLHAPSGKLTIDMEAGPFPDGLTDRIVTRLAGQFPALQLKPDVKRNLNLAGMVTLEDLHRLSVDDLSISDGNLEATANGTIDLKSRAADFKSRIAIAELGDYATLAELPYRGAATFQVDVASSDTPGTLVALVDGSLENLDSLPSEVQGLTGSSVQLHAQGRYDGETASVQDLALKGEGIAATGRGDFNRATQTVSASVAVALEDISPLGALARRPLAGSASFTLDVSGPVDAMTAKGALRGEHLDLDVARAEIAAVTFSATGIPSAPEAAIEATLEQAGEMMALHTQLARKDTTLRIATLELAAGENRITGQGAFDLKRLRGYGDVTADLPDLARLRTWINVPLDGSLHLLASLAEGTGALTGTLQADGVVASTMKLGHAEGTFDIVQIFTSPSGAMNLSAANLDAGEIHLASLSITADGPPSGLALAVKTEGVYQEITRFNLDGGGLLSIDTVSFDLKDLNVGVEDFGFALGGPATLSWRDGAATLSPLSLEGESGHLEMAGHYGADSVDLHAQWTDVSLGLVELAGMDPRAGFLSGSLAVTGDASAPNVVAEATLEDYNPEPDDQNDFPGLDVELKAVAGAGSLRVSLAARVPDAAEFHGEFTLPLAFSVSPWNLHVPQNAPLEGTLTGHADLTAVPPVFDLEGQDLRGRLEADLKAAGTLDKPGLAGAVTVADGYYEIGGTSTIFNDLAIRLEANGNTIRLAKFTANDGAGGAFTGEGWITLDLHAGSTYEITLKLGHSRLVHRDDLRAQGDGELKLKGDGDGAMLTGNLAVSPAYATIPESSGETQVTTVPFTVAQAEGETEPVEEPPAYEMGLDLTLDFPGKVFVSGTGLDSEWEGKLHLTNQMSDPAIEGVLRVKKGTLDFLGRDFSLAESTITFDGQTPPAPYLRIDALTTTDEIEAHIRMEGVQDALKLTLDSDPPLPQDEILSRVLFGQRLSDVSPVQALTLARYAPLFKKNVSGRSVLGSEGPKPFLVDRISLNSGTEVGEASITTGKYLSDDFYLEFEQGLGSAESLVSLDWLFRPQWSLKAKTTSRGEGGFGVFWKKNY